MKKLLLTATLALLGGTASAAPGFVKAVFSGSAYNGTSDIWSSQTVVSSADMMYRGGTYGYYNTTFGYACYMFFSGRRNL